MATILERRGKHQFQAQIRVKGYPLQCKTFETKREAKAWIAVITSEQVRGVFTDRSEAEQTTLREALERYAREVTPNKRSARSELVKIRFLMQHPLAARSLASLRNTDFAAYRDERLKVLRPNSVRLELAVLSNLFTVAEVRWSIPLVNPLLKTEKPALPEGRDRRFEGDEETRLLASADRSRVAPYLSACIKLAFQTGMRASEILGLEWQHVKLQSNYVMLPKTKNGGSRFVPLSVAAVDLLNSLPRPIAGGRVIRAFGGDVCALDKAFRRACIKAGIEGLNFHDMRHEAASRLAPRMPVQTLAKVFGWKCIQMAMRYYNPTPEELVVAVRGATA